MMSRTGPRSGWAGSKKPQSFLAAALESLSASLAGFDACASLPFLRFFSPLLVAPFAAGPDRSETAALMLAKS